MALRTSAVLLLAAVAAGDAAAQGRPAPRPVTDTSIFAPLVLPTPNEFRAGSGAPGYKYWQNRADYTLRTTLDTAATSVTTDMTLRYTNNSPDTLRFIWLQTEQNAFRAKSLNSLIFSEDSRFGARGFDGGYVFSRIEQRLGTATAPRRVKLVTKPSPRSISRNRSPPVAAPPST
jgi:hypothetical protein